MPGRPELDRLLEEAAAPLQWDAAAGDGEGAYKANTLAGAPTAGVTTQFSRHTTLVGQGGHAEGALADAWQVEERLTRSLAQGGLLVLTAEPRLARRAETELLHRYGPGPGPGDARAPALPLQRLSFDALMLQALKTQATTARVDWGLVLRADAAEPGSRDWANLMRLVQRTLPALRAALLQSPQPLLLVHLGLLARYELMALVSELEASAGRPGHTPAAWLLLPTHRQGPPLIDEVALPLVNNIHHSQALALPQAWIENKHRAGLLA